MSRWLPLNTSRNGCTMICLRRTGAVGVALALDGINVMAFLKPV